MSNEPSTHPSTAVLRSAGVASGTPCRYAATSMIRLLTSDDSEIE